MSRVADVKTRISSVELLATLKKSYSYRELSAVLGLSAPILSRYVRGHVLPSPARSEKFIATFREKLLRKMIMDSVKVSQDGSYDVSEVVSNVGLLRQIAKVVYSEFSLVNVDRVLTMEVDGVPALAAGLAVGSLVVYAMLHSRMTPQAVGHAQQVFEQQKGQLEASFRETYEAKLGE